MNHFRMESLGWFDLNRLPLDMSTAEIEEGKRPAQAWDVAPRPQK
jgi:hypothetical protein